MSRNLREFFKTIAIKFKTKSEKIVKETILGEEYHVIKGTIRTEPDYDDAWLLALSQEADTIFDIGCNIGQAALLMMHTQKVREIVLVDPNPSALAQAARNLILNHRSGQARFVCAFASDEPGEMVVFYTVGSGAAGSMYPGHAETASKLSSSYNVPTITVDSMVETYAILPDLVKIDTEGAESLVLEGAKQLASKMHTAFFVEMHSQPELSMRENAERILNWCDVNNYQAWYLKEKTKLTEPDQIAHRGRCHLLLLPANKPFPSYLLPLKQGARIEDVFLENPAKILDQI